MTNAKTIAKKSPTTTRSEMLVIYRGKRYEVADTNYFGDTTLYGLKSRCSGGSIFTAKKDDCRPSKSQ